MRMRRVLYRAVVAPVMLRNLESPHHSYHVHSYLLSSTPGRGPCRKTCTSTWPEHLGGLQKLSNRTEESLKQTEPCCVPAEERWLEYTPTLQGNGKRVTHTSQQAFKMGSLWFVRQKHVMAVQDCEFYKAKTECVPQSLTTEELIPKWKNQKNWCHRQRHRKQLTVKLPTKHWNAGMKPVGFNFKYYQENPFNISLL